jgi:hypothetical protein
MKYSKRVIVFAAGLMLTGLVLVANVRSEEKLHWDASCDKTFALKLGDKIVWQFHADPAEEAKPYFHPLAVAGGLPLTTPKPKDHPWHLAHWFSWKYINGVNYWEHDANGKPAGVTAWETPAKDLHGDGSAEIKMNLVYYPNTTPDKPVLKEQRTIIIAAPAADGSYTLDWTQDFTAATDVKLDRTPVTSEPGGAVWGGYAGLAIRFNGDMTDIQFAASDWTKKRDRQHFRFDLLDSPSLEFNGILDGKEYGVAITSSPKNFGTGDWYVINEQHFKYMNPVILLREPHSVKEGETFTLKHRVYVHPGRWNDEKIRSLMPTF